MSAKEYLKIIKVGDILIILLLVVSVVISSGWYWFGEGEGKDKMVVVEIQGEVVKELEFPSEGEEEIITVEIPRGEADIELQNDRVRVQRMSTDICPKGICADTGWITRTGETIVCMPNEMTITIDPADDGERELDGVTG